MHGKMVMSNSGKLTPKCLHVLVAISDLISNRCLSICEDKSVSSRPHSATDKSRSKYTLI